MSVFELPLFDVDKVAPIIKEPLAEKVAAFQRHNERTVKENGERDKKEVPYIVERAALLAAIAVEPSDLLANGANPPEET